MGMSFEKREITTCSSKFVFVLALMAVLGLSRGGSANAGNRVRIQGSTTVNPVVVDAVEVLKASRGLDFSTDTLGGSSGGINAVAQGLVEIGMASREISERDLRKHPDVDFRVTPIAIDAVALVVSAPVWDGGVHALTRDQIRAIFEGKITNWNEVGGADLSIFVYDKEPGRGTREVFEKFAYGSDEPPIPDFAHYAQVGGNEETRSKVQDHDSAISQLSFAWTEGTDKIHALGIRLESGEIVRPDRKAILSNQYPIVRRLNLITDGPPCTNCSVLIDFMKSSEGQDIVKKHGYLPLDSADDGS